MTNGQALIEFDKFFGRVTDYDIYTQLHQTKEQLIAELVLIDTGKDIIALNHYCDIDGWDRKPINIKTWRKVINEHPSFVYVLGKKNIKKFLKILEG